MALRFIGKDPESQGGNCPTVLVDEETFALVFQATRANEDTTAGAGKYGPLPDHEIVVTLPAHMVPLIRKACDVAERKGLQDDPGVG